MTTFTGRVIGRLAARAPFDVKRLGACLDAAEGETMNAGRCSQCGGPIQPKAANPAFPFCSARCKWVDLSKWIAGEYRIAVGGGESERDSPVAESGGVGQSRDAISVEEEVN
jgi:hypothetical protein